jgi:cysteine dioxygenase
MNLQELFNLIKNTIKLNDNKNINHLTEIIKKYDGNDWILYRAVNTDNYNRILIDKNDDFDMYIITWNKYQKSPVHDHSKNGCIYKILQGTIMEKLYDNNLKLKGSKLVCKNNIGYIDNTIGYHKMENNTDEVVVSLHIYSPANYKTTYFI